ncbi:class I SAM-dependent methyltransferase [Paenibacillus hemerocallicola]|uniref:Class I SAM-dependent methyltransferase n=1 Tax=Paenibacillus hemerocallicola TaxID=1172614 RepID=A0A5C4TEU0_9BACL|nr:class I SAM-dependent methyltransferase [Paenibacillus hemerocallicola]TNJ67010.1 class I SAM-dependent methyltransferase [Paenibacillus hemerocallicola]
MNSNQVDYRSFYDRVGLLNGWDFGKIKVVSEGEQWDFYEEVTRRCKKSDVLLDIGTGGGERLLSIADRALLLVGIDQANGMIRTANANLLKTGKPNIRFLQMDAENLEFPEGFFNIVSCRHCAFHAEEVAKVLVQGGIFLTQQVCEGDKRNIAEMFGRGQFSGSRDDQLIHTYRSELNEAGFSDIRSFEYDATEYYQTYEDLVFLLKYTPIVPGFGQSENDFAVLEKFIEQNQTDQGIRTNSKRFMLIATK